MEQDLVLSRALVEVYSDPAVAAAVAFRGGTALHKLHLDVPRRYSEDLDFVQVAREPIGAVLDAIRARLDPWLGVPRRKIGHGLMTLLYRFETSFEPVQQMRLKVEINTREHLTVLGLESREWSVDSRWFAGSARVTMFKLEEMLGTKLRALYQRKKGRDLYDLWLALSALPIEEERLVECFQRYCEHEGRTISRADLEENLSGKMLDPAFLGDIAPLLPAGVAYDPETAAKLVRERLLVLIPGEPWKGTEP